MKIQKQLLSIFIICCLIPFFAACHPIALADEKETSIDWKRSHLIFLDQPEECDPSSDIVAVYFQENFGKLLIRVDLLSPDENTINNLKIDFNLPVDPVLSLENAVQDFFVFSIPAQKEIKPSLLRLMISTSTSDGILIDNTPFLHAQPITPPPAAPLLLAFTHELSSQTPAQLLRTWDGAHTGPYGRRHGLKHLLDSVAEYHIPAFLLDLNTIENLSALDYINQISFIREQVQNGLLVLPNQHNIYTQYSDFALTYAQNFNLPSSPFFVQKIPALSLPDQNPTGAALNRVIGSHSKSITLNQAIPPANWPVATSAKIDFPSSWKNALLQIASTSDTQDLLVLGGDLQTTVWADATIAPVLFSYISNHPWIQPIDGYRLRQFLDSPISPITPGQSSAAHKTIIEQLTGAPTNNLTQTAWKTFITLQEKDVDERLENLKQQYLPQVQRLLSAASWSESPMQASQCNQDSCILSSNEMYIHINLTGGGIALAVYKHEGMPLQWLASSAQMAVGLSDPSDWITDAGEYSDPAVIPGAFVDPYPPQTYHPLLVESGLITLQNEDRSITKTFIVDTDRFSFEIETMEPIQIQIPIIFSTESQYSPSWLDQIDSTALSKDSYQMGWNGEMNGMILSIQNANQTDLSSYKDSQQWMQSPEDPDQEYPAGHYLPFSLLVINLEIAPDSDFTATFYLGGQE